MKPICQPTDLVEPICQGLCEDNIRPEIVVKPIAGGRQVVSPIEPFDPAPPGLAQKELNLNTNTRGDQLGTAGTQGGNDAFSNSSAGSSGAAGGGSSR